MHVASKGGFFDFDMDGTPNAIGDLSTTLAIITVVISSTLYPVYTFVFHYRYGATLGKMAVKINVTKPDGSPISLSQSAIWYIAYFIFGLLLSVLQIMFIFQIESMRSALIVTSLSSPINPLWYQLLTVSTFVWILSDICTFMFNTKHKALHDVMAGTVVINSKARQSITIAA